MFPCTCNSTYNHVFLQSITPENCRFSGCLLFLLHIKHCLVTWTWVDHAYIHQWYSSRSEVKIWVNHTLCFWRLWQNDTTTWHLCKCPIEFNWVTCTRLSDLELWRWLDIHVYIHMYRQRVLPHPFMFFIMKYCLT